MESLSDILNQYSRHGVPDSVHAQSAVADEEALQALYSLEEDWRQLMDPSGKLTLTSVHQYMYVYVHTFRFDRTSATTTDGNMGADIYRSCVH